MRFFLSHTRGCRTPRGPVNFQKEIKQNYEDSIIIVCKKNPESV